LEQQNYLDHLITACWNYRHLDSREREIIAIIIDELGYTIFILKSI
jgi:hypothetical protein